MLWENEEQEGIKAVLRNHRAKSIGLFVGPEGGFSDEEVRKAIENGCIPVTFGPNILRTETAAIVSVAIVTYEFRDA